MKDRAELSRRLSGLALRAVCVLMAWGVGVGLAWGEELERVLPEEVELSSQVLAKIRPAVEKLIADEVVPGATVVVGREGKIVYQQTMESDVIDEGGD